MKDYDPVMLAAVIHELLGNWIWVLALLAAGWLWVMVAALRRGRGGASWRVSLLLGAVVWIGTIAVLPSFTGSAFRHLNGITDWVVLMSLGLGLGIAAALLVWPVLRLWTTPER